MSDEANELALAFAFVLDSLAIRVSVNWGLKFFKPKVPVKIFNDTDKALQWLQQFK